MASRTQDLVDQIIGSTCSPAPCFTSIGKQPAEGDLLQDMNSGCVPLRMAAISANRQVWAYAEEAARTERIAERSARILAENTRHLVEAPFAVSANAVGADASAWLHGAGLTEGLRRGAVEALTLWTDLKSARADGRLDPTAPKES